MRHDRIEGGGDVLPDGTAADNSPLKNWVPNRKGSAMFRLLSTTAVVAGGLIVALPAFSQTTHPGGMAPATVPKDALSQQDKDFVKSAAEGGMAEVELSKIAEKSENPEVKRFAEQMVRDHSAANADLTSTAVGLGAEMPKTLDTEHQKIRDRLRTMHGAAFDRQYMQVMVEDHDQAAKLFRQESGLAHNPELKQFAQKTLPIIEQHQKMAVALSHRLSETAAK
jgi:putative membrane protein